MNKLLPVLLILLNTSFNQNAVAQKFVSTANRWAYINQSPFTGEYQTQLYKFGNDTTINQIIYSKLLWSTDSTQTYWDFSNVVLREDSTSKIYFYNFSTSQEELLYDFNLQVGDTLYSHCDFLNDTVFYILSNIDSVLLNDNNYNENFLFDVISATPPNQMFVNELWLNEIGSLHQLISYNGAPCYPFADPGLNSLLCFSRNDTVLYSNPNFNTCYKNTVGEKNSDKQSFKINPNPSNGKFAISISYSQNVSVTVRDLLGRIVYFTNNAYSENVINLSEQVKGIYVLTINAKGINYRKKIAIE